MMEIYHLSRFLESQKQRKSKNSDHQKTVIKSLSLTNQGHFFVKSVKDKDLTTSLVSAEEMNLETIVHTDRLQHVPGHEACRLIERPHPTAPFLFFTMKKERSDRRARDSPGGLHFSDIFNSIRSIRFHFVKGRILGIPRFRTCLICFEHSEKSGRNQAADGTENKRQCA